MRFPFGSPRPFVRTGPQTSPLFALKANGGKNGTARAHMQHAKTFRTKFHSRDGFILFFLFVLLLAFFCTTFLPISPCPVLELVSLFNSKVLSQLPLHLYLLARQRPKNAFFLSFFFLFSSAPASLQKKATKRNGVRNKIYSTFTAQDKSLAASHFSKKKSDTNPNETKPPLVCLHHNGVASASRRSRLNLKGMSIYRFRQDLTGKKEETKTHGPIDRTN